jgi:hypothetical protein
MKMLSILFGSGIIVVSEKFKYGGKKGGVGHDGFFKGDMSL